MGYRICWNNKNESDIKYFGITDNVTSYGEMCGDKNVDANNYQIDFDKYPQSKIG